MASSSGYMILDNKVMNPRLLHHDMPQEWAPQPDPLAASYLQRVLEENQISPEETQAADSAVAACLDSAGKAYLKIKHVEPMIAAAREDIATLGVDACANTPSGVRGSTNSAAIHVQPPQPKRKRLPGGALPFPASTHPLDSLNETLNPSSPPPSAPKTTPHDTSNLNNNSTNNSTESIPPIPTTPVATSKGLKHFSLKVCEKVEDKKETNYNEVADELVKEMAADAAAGLGEGSYDEKNVRRRVYDALNVLEALGMIEKDKKDIRWKGWPPALGQSPLDRLQAEKAKLAARLERKVAVAVAVASKAFCLSNLVLRNNDAPLPVLLAAQDAGMPSPNPLALPFMLVHAPAESVIDVDLSADKKKASIDFGQWPFQVHDDERVMKLMGLGVPCQHLTSIASRNIKASAIRHHHHESTPPLDTPSLDPAVSLDNAVEAYAAHMAAAMQHESEMAKAVNIYSSIDVDATIKDTPMKVHPHASSSGGDDARGMLLNRNDTDAAITATGLPHHYLGQNAVNHHALPEMSPSAGVSAMMLNSPESRIGANRKLIP